MSDKMLAPAAEAAMKMLSAFNAEERSTASIDRWPTRTFRALGSSERTRARYERCRPGQLLLRRVARTGAPGTESIA
jgi:hypothetical protein